MPQPVVIITSSADRPFESYAPEDLIRDMKMDVYFETQEMMEDCLLLLRFNCPDVSCDYIAAGWPELKHHTRTVHGLLLWCVLGYSISTSQLMVIHQQPLSSIQKDIFSRTYTLYPSATRNTSSNSPHLCFKTCIYLCWLRDRCPPNM